MSQRDFALVVVIFQVKLLGFCPFDELPEQDLTSAVLVWKNGGKKWDMRKQHRILHAIYSLFVQQEDLICYFLSKMAWKLGEEIFCERHAIYILGKGIYK